MCTIFPPENAQLKREKYIIDLNRINEKRLAKGNVCRTRRWTIATAIHNDKACYRRVTRSLRRGS